MFIRGGLVHIFFGARIKFPKNLIFSDAIFVTVSTSSQFLSSIFRACCALKLYILQFYTVKPENVRCGALDTNRNNLPQTQNVDLRIMDFKGNFEIVGGEKSPKRLVSRCAYGASTIDKTSKQHGGGTPKKIRFTRSIRRIYH